MDLLAMLDEVCPDWRVEVASCPLEAASLLGLLDDEPSETHGELDFNDDRANWRRYMEDCHE
jgi:hypothetical protein